MAGQACAWASVGAGGVRAKPAAAAGWNDSRMCMTYSLPRSFYSNARRPALVSSGMRGIFRIQRHEFPHHAIGPAEAVLQRIFAAAAKPPGGNDIVFLH